MTHENPFRQLIDRFRTHAGVDPAMEDGEESLIGFFQNYRPDGLALADLFDDLPRQQALSDRVERLFQAAGNDRRPQGGRDAYFVVRNCETLSPEEAETWAAQWLESLGKLGRELDQDVSAIVPAPTIRVLQGIPPKHPKVSDGRTRVLSTLLESVPSWTEQIHDHPDAQQMRRVFYFVACDPHLRDYLMWPLYAESAETDDPFAPYFELWRHRIKYRSYKEGQLDLYLPI